jgi:hypothetical protein
LAAISHFGFHETAVALIWHERVVEPLPGRQLRIVVPVLGDALNRASSAPLSRLLDRLWVGRLSEPSVSSVVASIGSETDDGRRLLTLILGIDPASTHVGRADNSQLARQLRGALRQVAEVPAAIA